MASHKASSSKRPQQAADAKPDSNAPQPTKKAKLDEIDLIFSKKPPKISEDSGAKAEGSSSKAGDNAQPGQLAKPGKKHKQGAKQGAAQQQQQQQQQQGTASVVVGSKDDIFGEEVGRGRKRTEEGYAIYSEAELGLNKKGGDSDLCPFDCDCCF